MAVFSMIGNAINGDREARAAERERQRQAEEDRKMAAELNKMREKELALQEKFMNEITEMMGDQQGGGAWGSHLGGGGQQMHGQQPLHGGHGHGHGCGAATPPPMQNGCGHAHQAQGQSVNQDQLDDLKEIQAELKELSAQNDKLESDLRDMRADRRNAYEPRSSGAPSGLLALVPAAHVAHGLFGVKFA